MTSEYSYWMALAHLPRWRTERINQLLIEILHRRQMALQDFFALSPDEWQQEFALTATEVVKMNEAKAELPNYAFLAEELSAQGFQIVPFNAPEYSAVLKKNLQIKHAPPVLYAKGNLKQLHEPTVAVVGSREASERALQFADAIAKKCAAEFRVVVSGFAKGVDKQALDSSLKYGGHSIIVLPQGILTFGGGIKKYYPQIVEGDVLVLSTFFPKAGWDAGLAMARNVYIYGLAEEIYVAESDNKGGTWTGVMDGLKKGRTIYVRQPESDEKNANSLLIAKGAIAVDAEGNKLLVDAAASKQDHAPETRVEASQNLKVQMTLFER